MSRTIKFAVAALCTALALAACGGSGTKTTAKAAKSTATTASASTKVESGHAAVMIKDFAYSPMHLTVTAGTKVSFHNYDMTAHTATALNQAFDTGTIEPGKTATITFKKPGVYKYHCLFHAFMMASITVVPAKT